MIQYMIKVLRIWKVVIGFAFIARLDFLAASNMFAIFERTDPPFFSSAHN